MEQVKITGTLIQLQTLSAAAKTDRLLDHVEEANENFSQIWVPVDMAIDQQGRAFAKVTSCDGGIRCSWRPSTMAAILWCIIIVVLYSAESE